MKDTEQNDDIISEESEEFLSEEEGEENLLAKLKKLKQDLRRCQSEKAEYLAGWQRSKADYLNLKKEEAERRADLSTFAKADVLNDLIRLADSFQMAFANKEAWESVPLNWRQGIEYIHSQLLVVFRDHGLEELDPLGQAFDPAIAEGVGSVETPNEEDDGKVVEVLKKGYRLAGKVIRPAQVRIGKFEN